jgi:hypothetical protein
MINENISGTTDEKYAIFSTVSGYIELLLESNFGPFLLNPLYAPPPPDTASLYIRPSVYVGDIIVWKEGLIPYYQFQNDIFSTYAMQSVEASTILYDRCKR